MKQFVLFLFCSTLAAIHLQAEEKKPLRALLVAGGCCHAYAQQQEVLAKGIQARANVRVDVYWTSDRSTSPIFPLYSKDDWAKNYDIIIHDECAASVKDEAIVNRILATHETIPAVHLHCAMHSFRLGNDKWFKHLGLQSSGHGPQAPIDIKFTDTKHPITATLKDWKTINEELYNNVKILDAHPLATGTQQVKNKEAKAVVVWTNEKQGARSFSTTIGHNTETVQDERYLELVTRGLLWACDKLNDDYLVPYKGKNEVVAIDGGKLKAEEKIKKLGVAPKNATLAKVTVSSTQSGHDAWHAIDGDPESRWCADGASYPQWLQLEFAEPRVLSSIAIDWEFPNRAYRFNVQGSTDGKKWATLLNHEENAKPTKGDQPLSKHEPMKFVRINGIAGNGWCSLWEVRLKGKDIGPLWPADAKGDPKKFEPQKADPYQKQGNIPPRIEKLTPEQEASILKDVKVADGFEATVFAAPPAVNYPVFVAATVDGTLYVSSDGNGSLGRDPKRGRVIRLRDLDGDGRADETKVFCEVDSPRGLVWDHDRLYLVHPPHLSEFIDNNGDGVADEHNILVKNIAFGFDKRPADHTTNGLSMGPDGKLYIAGGDFGFMSAEGTDGRKLTHRGGGVIRVNPDGTELEIYSRGTRNILEVAISPQLEIFARDNTNDGGGWNVRFHHFTGMDDHGYPRLYKNFASECIAPLADYGGGSGCGAVYIDEPGFGKWNNAPFTADWGTGAIYRHAVSPKGATYEETAKPEPFIRMTRPTDADVDGNSRVYAASWKGATFKWQGPNVGYIVRVQPVGNKPAPLPDFQKATPDQLVEILKSPSYRRRMKAQRTLSIVHDHSATDEHLQEALASRNDSRNRVHHLQTNATAEEMIAALNSEDRVIVHVAINCLARANAHAECLQALDKKTTKAEPLLRALAKMHTPATVDGLIRRLPTTKSPELYLQIVAALCRLHFKEGVWKGDSWGTRPDTRGPYYQPEAWSQTGKIANVLQDVLKSSDVSDAAAVLDLMAKNRIESNQELGALVAQAMKNQKVVPLAISRLADAGDISPEGFKLLAKTSLVPGNSPNVSADLVVALTKVRTPQAVAPMLMAMADLDKHPGETSARLRAESAFFSSANLEAQATVFLKAASDSDDLGRWAEMAVLAIADDAHSSPESQEAALEAIQSAWKQPARRQRLMQSAVRIRTHLLDDEILAARNSTDQQVASVARNAADRLKIEAIRNDKTPKIQTLDFNNAVKQALTVKGDIEIGQQVFRRANCTACHTVDMSQPQKGPFLGNIAKTYKRPDLAANILNPDKTIAQGFTTNTIATEDGKVITGFVTRELADSVTLRDNKGKEFTIPKHEIEARKTSTKSVMPAGLMNEFSAWEFSSLLDYLQSLSKE